MYQPRQGICLRRIKIFTNTELQNQFLQKVLFYTHVFDGLFYDIGIILKIVLGNPLFLEKNAKQYFFHSFLA